MNTVCVGISHQTAPAELRAQMRFSAGEIRSAHPRIRALGLSECVLFSSNDRTELYAAGYEGIPSVDELVRFLMSEKGGESPIPAKSFFSLKGGDAVEHLLRVAAGLDSMIIGDTETLGAISEGFAIAQETGAAGFLLQQIFAAAQGTHDKAKARTLISDGAISVSSAAVELAQRIFDDLTQRRALIIGAGETAQMTARLLHAKGIGSLAITHKNPERASQLAATVGGTTIPFDAFRELLPGIDIIIASLQSEPHILTSRSIKEVGKSRHGQTLFLIDCGIPHNIDPFAGELENVFLYDLDTLNLMVSESIAQRRAHAPDVEAIVQEELKRLLSWYSSLETSPTVEALGKVIEKIRSEEVAREIHRFKSQDRKVVDDLTKRITERIVQIPAEHLKMGREGRLPDRLQNVSLVRKLFGLDSREDDPSDKQ
ncbi:MAG: glutamyl-tRNA reductase [Ignavibacteria bacterium GWA2_54_16]|nr:MAG: glutamyl-tRNA reductase [Ignavibacteria bacterium GWA2_54_16]